MELSIIITYSVGRFEQFKRGLNSLYFQNVDFKNVELLFFNDGGEIEIINLLRKYSGKFKIRYYYANKNSNRFCFHNRNFLIRRSSGNYIMISDPEVLHCSDTIDQALKASRKFGENIWYSGKTFGTLSMLDKKGNFRSTDMKKDVREDINILIGKEPIYKEKINLNFFKNNKKYYLLNRKSHPYPMWSAVVKKSNLEKVRGFNENMIKWGFDEASLWNRLKQIGVRQIYDKDMIVYHLPHKKILNPEERKCWCVYNANIPFTNNKNWGNLEYEEIKEIVI
jgi:hypothetical protein